MDPTGKATGRGAYLHDARSCWERGLKGTLAHALKIDLTDQDRVYLKNFLANLPEESSVEADSATKNEGRKSRSTDKDKMIP